LPPGQQNGQQFHPFSMQICQIPGSRSLLNFIGIIILFFGGFVGAAIYLKAPQSVESEIQTSLDSDDGDLALSPEDSRKYGRGMEMIFGKVGVLLIRWSRAFSSLGDPKPLGTIVFLMSVLAAGGCFTLAARAGKKAAVLKTPDVF